MKTGALVSVVSEVSDFAFALRVCTLRAPFVIGVGCLFTVLVMRMENH
jgi:hypothetical protein